MQDVVFKLEDGSKVTFKQDTKLVFKFNPYHDKLGRFTTSDGAVSFTYKPGASSSHDKAIAVKKREKLLLVQSPKATPKTSRASLPRNLKPLKRSLPRMGLKIYPRKKARAYAGMQA